MMKYLLLFSQLLLAVDPGYSQPYRIEQVEWMAPKIFKARSFLFKTDSITYEARNCKIMEFRTISGVTGYYVSGEATIHISIRNMTEKCTAAMFRFNPLDHDSLIITENLKEIKDDGFVMNSLNVLKKSFRHCYHSGMDAIIPDREVYAINFFSPKLGEILVSRDRKEYLFYNYTLRSRM